MFVVVLGLLLVAWCLVLGCMVFGACLGAGSVWFAVQGVGFTFWGSRVYKSLFRNHSLTRAAAMVVALEVRGGHGSKYDARRSLR